MSKTKCLIAASCFAVASAHNICGAFAQTAPASWSGAYGGVFGEYSGGQSSQNDNDYSPPKKKPNKPVAPVGGEGGGGPPVGVNRVGLGDGNYGLSGGIGGGLVGYNYQFNQFVLGAEGDIGAGSIAGSSSACGIPAHFCSTRIGAMADIRGRFGYAIGNIMPFVAGGAAFADLHAGDGLYSSSGNAWRAGYTIGGGVEYKITPQVALRLEYLHTRFDPKTLYDIVPNVPERVGATNEIVRAGILFYLTPPSVPVVAKY